MNLFGSELIWLLLQPSTLATVMLLLALLLLMFRRVQAGGSLLFVGLLIVLLPALLPVRELLASPLEDYFRVPTPMPQQVDGILVLGGAVHTPITIARGQLTLGESAERMIAAAALARRYPDAQLVMTGVFGDNLGGEFTPQGGAYTFFDGPEFSPERMTWVGAARSTYEDALLSLEAVEPSEGERWLLVTSAWHMPRAVGVFQALGWQVVPYPVDYRSRGVLELNPSVDIGGRLSDLDQIVREWGALIVYQQLGRTQRLFPHQPQSQVLQGRVF